MQRTGRLACSKSLNKFPNYANTGRNCEQFRNLCTLLMLVSDWFRGRKEGKSAPPTHPFFPSCFEWKMSEEGSLSLPCTVVVVHYFSPTALRVNTRGKAPPPKLNHLCAFTRRSLKKSGFTFFFFRGGQEIQVCLHFQSFQDRKKPAHFLHLFYGPLFKLTLYAWLMREPCDFCAVGFFVLQAGPMEAPGT